MDLVPDTDPVVPDIMPPPPQTSLKKKVIFFSLVAIIGVCSFVIFLSSQSAEQQKEIEKSKAAEQTQLSPIPVTFTNVYTLSALTDIANQNGNNLESFNQTINWIGNADSAASSYLGLRFTGPAILPTDQIQSASLEITSSKNDREYLKFAIFAEKNPNSVTFSTTALPSKRLLTTSSTYLNLDEKWTIGQKHTFDVTAPIKELLSSTGNNGIISLIAKGQGKAYYYNFFYNNNQKTNPPPKLTVVVKRYSFAPPSPTIAITTIPSVTINPTLTTAPKPTTAPFPTSPPLSGGWWKPTTDKPIHFQWQIGTIFIPSTDFITGVNVYDIDGFDNSATTVKAIKDKGNIAICYVDVGGWESGRSDSGCFPASVRGAKMAGWPEYYLDIRSQTVRDCVTARIHDQCALKGFDAVEPDVIDAYANKSGFPLTAQDQINYNRFLADTIHSLGMSAGLKGDTDQAPQLAPYFDWTLNEECANYNECDQLNNFLSANKAVFQVEYTGGNTFCADANTNHRNAQRRNLDLTKGGTRVVCIPDTQNTW